LRAAGDCGVRFRRIGKLFSEAIEAADQKQIEGIRPPVAMRCTKYVLA
jgi:ABC-type phosphate/phosphonate transport system permease subunit